MQITGIEPILVDQYLFVRIHTDEGITGLGESGTWGFLEASAGALETFKGYLLGQNPLQIEHHWQYMYRNSHFRGAAIMGALSALDIALWDIAGKYYDVPVHRLLGGPVRKKARVYGRAYGETTEELIASCEHLKDEGFTAIGHLNPFTDVSRSEPYFETHSTKISTAVDRVEQCREAVGSNIDLCLEIHRRLDPHEAITLAQAIESYHPMFLEDPVRPENFDSMKKVSEKTSIPIATGERLLTHHEFEMLLKRDAVDLIRPDVCLAGGLTHVKKIAGLAEAHFVQVVPHNPLSPVSTAVGLQLAACIPNFALQEYPYTLSTSVPGQDLVENAPEYDHGYLAIPEEPGIGIKLNESAIENRSYEQRDFTTRLHEDGSVVDT